MPRPDSIQLKDKHGRVLVEMETPDSIVATSVTAGLVRAVFIKHEAKQYTGYVQKSVLDELNVSTVQIPANFAGLEAVDTPTRLMDQLFEIYDVDEQDEFVEISARHIFYRNLKNYTLWKPTEDTSYTAAAVIRNVMSNAMFDSEFEAASDCTDTKPGKDFDYERKNLVECFLDPENGICAKFGLSLIRDNGFFYCLKNVGYDRGYLVQSGKNLLGVERIENMDGVATRVAAYGKDAKGNIVWMDYNGQKYVDSQYISSYAAPMAEIYETDLQIGKDGVTADNIQAKLLEAAQKRFSEDEIDKPEVTMTINFISLGDTEEYAQYRGLDKVYLYDILTIRDTKRGYNYSAQVIGVEHDILTGRLISVTIGSIKNADAKRKIASWQVPEVSGTNIRLLSLQAGLFAPGAIQNSDLARNIITADLINTTDLNAINATLGTATITDGYIDNAYINFARLKAATAESLIARDAVTDRYFIDKLQVTNLQAVNATVGGLVIKASDNKYYRLDIDENGELQHTEVTPTSAQIAAGAMGTGAIIETDLTVQDLAAANVKAINGLIDKLTASRIDVDELFARSAFIGKLNTTSIESTASLAIKSGGSFTVETGGTFTVQSGNFSINSSGNVYVAGEVHAGANSVIGGWTLGASRLYSGTGAGYVAMDSDTSGTYAIWAGAESAASAPFRVARSGAMASTSGTIGGFNIAATTLTGNKTGLAVTTQDSDVAFWAGSATAGSANFRVTQGGDVYLRSLKVLNEQGTETTVDLRSYPLWKLSYATVKSISVGDDSVTIVTTAGTYSFNRGSGGSITLSGAWTDNWTRYTVTATQGGTVVGTISSGAVSADMTNAEIKADLEASSSHLTVLSIEADGETLGTRTIDASGVYTQGWNSGYDTARGYVTMPGAGTGTSFTVGVPKADRSGSENRTFTITKGTPSASGGYAAVQFNNSTVCRISLSDWWTGGVNSVTVSAAGWQNGKNRVNASNGKYADVSLPSFTTSQSQNFSNHKKNVSFYTASVTGALVTTEVDATSEYNAGWTGSYQAVTLSATGTKSLTYGESVTVYPRAKASASASAADITTISYKITAPADRYQTGYNAGHLAGVASVTITKVEQQGAITYSNGNYSVPAKATASNSATGAGTITFSGAAAYNAGWNAALAACGIPGGGNVRTGGTYYSRLYTVGTHGEPILVGSGYIGVNTVHVDGK